MPKFTSSNDGYRELPDDTPLPCVISDVEEQDGKNFDGVAQKQLLVKFEVFEGEFIGEKFRTWVNAETFHPKSNTRKLCYAAFGIEDLKREDVEIDTDELVDRKLLVIGDYGENGESSFFKPRKYKVYKATKGAVPKPANGSRSTKPAQETTPAEPERKPEPVAATAATASEDLDF